jgi:putative Ca2+/H+ antiporter (TMEM165/GDT1 family)
VHSAETWGGHEAGPGHVRLSGSPARSHGTASVLARWAAALLAVSAVATASLAVLPESFDRPMAVPEGVALIALGISLWRDQRQTAPTAASTTARVEHSAVR